METCARLFALTLFVGGAGVGCNAILGIGEPVVEGAPDGAAGDAAVAGGEGGTDTPGTDAGVDAAVDASVEDADPGPPCNLASAFTVVEPIGGVNLPGQEGSPRLSEDEKTLYFDSQRAGGPGGRFDLYVATRASKELPFSDVTLLPGDVNSADDEYSPNVVDNGLTILFERQNVATQVSKLMRATRLAVTDPWSTATDVPDVNGGACDYSANPFARGTQDQLFFVRACAGTAADIFLGKRVNDSYAGFARVAKLNTTNQAEYEPTITLDGNTIFFARQQAGKLDIFEASWDPAKSDWNTPQSLPGTAVNGTLTNETPGWVSPDGCRLYFTSTRGAPGGGMQDLFVASRPRVP